MSSFQEESSSIRLFRLQFLQSFTDKYNLDFRTLTVTYQHRNVQRPNFLLDIGMMSFFWHDQPPGQTSSFLQGRVQAQITLQILEIS